MLARALEEGVLQPYKPPNLSLIPREYVFDKTYHVTPFDYGYFAICYDTLRLTDPPKSLADLLKPEYKSKIILEDPRTSSPGLGFLLWTVAVYGEGYAGYWEKLKPNVLTITEGWDSAYGLFTGGEAPMVLSYTTSPAYHVEYEKTNRYRALIFKEGNYLQIEGIGVLKGARNARLARQFIDFALAEDFQTEIPLTNWMFPINPKVRLPDSFRYAPKPEKTLSLDAKDIEKNGKRWVDGWLKAVSK
jgi:thiamine transport system substrate-binding protein